MERKKILWIARDTDGSLWLFADKPKRFDGMWLCAEHNIIGNISNIKLPDVKWENSPKKLIITTEENE